MKKALPLIALLACSLLTYSQDKLSYWKKTVKNNNALVLENKKGISSPNLFTLDVASLKNDLVNASTRTGKVKSNVEVSFPNAAGKMKRFSIYENSTMEPELQARYPEIRSYVGQGIDNPGSLIYFSVSPLGVQTMLINPDESAEFIEPYTSDLSSYVVYRKSDKAESLAPFECSVIAAVNPGNSLAARPNADDGTLRTFRLALSVTGEYTVFFGGTKPLALAAMNASMTRVNGVFEIDFNVHMNMIAGEDPIIYTNAATDPYSNASTGANGAWNQELQTNLTNTIGNAGYDVGHLFGASGGGGNAGCISCVCVNPTAGTPLGKGSGFTSPADAIPQGDDFDIDYVAHEMGHQFGGNHTFTFSTESGTGAQMEPGSGSTIMGYAGITGATDVQPHSDAFFHAISIQQITNYIKTTACQVNTPTGNAIPTANAGLDYTIPKGTPFKLTGAGTDANGGDVLTYCWEEMDLGTSSTTNPSVSATSGPAFKSFLPTTSTFRYFPQLATIKTGATSWQWEAVPNVARNLNFRLTVRDNHAGGPANNSDDMIVTVNATAGPFIVTVPNTNVIWPGGTTQTVTWNVAGTTANNVNTANVDILLSTDGGNTYPITILSATPNDGSQSITVPNNFGATNRIMVKGTNHIFFDISDVNFRITDPSGGITAISTSPLAGSSFCPGASVNVDFTTDGVAQAGNIFTAQLSNAAGSFASPVSIGTLSSINSGTIASVIPSNTVAGSGYRIRVVSSAPALTGTDNGTNLTVQGIPTTPSVSPAGPVSFCSGGSSTLSYSQVGGVAYQWRKNGVAIAGQTGASLNVTTAGSYDVIGGLAQTFTNATPVSIVDNNCTTGNSPIAISGYTGTVTSSAISIKINITHTWVGDLVIALQAPNGSILGLSNLTGSASNSGDNFTNTIFSDAGATVIPTSGAPYTNTYKPVAATFTNCVTTTITSFGAIGGGAINPNGNWTLLVYDRASQDVGTIVNWSISFPATVNDPCVATSNTVAVSISTVDDGNPCTSDGCNTSTGTATHTPVDVNDNNGCTTDACNTSTGAITHTNVSVDDSNPCTTDACNTSTGAITHTAVPVDDGNGCTTDACDTQSGTISHTAVSIDDNNACTDDACDTQSGTITHTQVSVDDGNACTNDACNSQTGLITHTPVNLDDNNNCTTDECDTQTGSITHTPIIGCGGCANPPTANAGGPYNACGSTTLNGSVGGGASSGTWSTSTGGLFIPDANTLNAVYQPSALDLSNGSVTITLTSDNPAGNPCVAAVNNTTITYAAVNDNNACTTDACNTSNGSVSHTPVITDDGNACTTDACNTSNGSISHTPVSVEDNNACTSDGCDSSSGVYHNPVNTDDNNVCTTDGCVSSTGTFHNQINTDDGNACTTDGCDSSTGIFHNPVNTNDGNACTTDGCNTSSGIFHNPVNTNDGNACTTDGCDSSTGVFHNPVNTDDGNACTTDGCNSSSGIFHTPVSTDDGNPCTTDACNTQNGNITHNPVTPVDDGNACTLDVCVTSTGTTTAFLETFDNIPGNTGTNGAYTFPAGWSLFNVDGRPGNPGNDPLFNVDGDAWERFAVFSGDSAAISTSWIDPPGQVDRWMVTPGITTSSNSTLSWNGLAFDPDFPDGYEVRLFTTPPTSGNLNSSTILFSIAEEDATAYQLRSVSLSAFPNQTVYIGFRNHSVDEYVLAIDDVKVTSSLIAGTTIHTPVVTDDGNACTTDGCNTSTGVFHNPVNTSDGNACTTDACNTSTGAITHTPSSTNDGNACTNDACNTSTGEITHTPVPIDDSNPCTADACNTSTGEITHTATPCGVELHSKIYLEAYYLGGGIMNNPLFSAGNSSNPLHSDLITISAMQASPPYNLVDSKTDTLYTNGNVQVKFGPAVIAGNSYYLKITHRNHIETWSANPVVLTPVVTYTFSDAANKAFADNQIVTHVTPGNPTSDGFGFALYCGDIWNGGTPDSGVQDGSVDATDFLALDPHIQGGDGGYITSDLNGDGSVDATDFLWLDPNIQGGIGSSTP